MSNIKKHILIVEDEKHLADALRLNLEMDNYLVTLVHDGNTASDVLLKQEFDIVLLDVMLPEVDGFQVCKKFRKSNTKTPVIFLSARNTSMDKIQGLRFGADDYIGKPFEYDELLLRINKLIERTSFSESASKHLFALGKASIDFIKMEAVNAKGVPINLSKIEFDMMRYFIENKEKAISREEIYLHIWGYNERSIPNSRTLDNFIMFLRKHFEPTPANPKHIISVRGVGYKFIP